MGFVDGRTRSDSRLSIVKADGHEPPGSGVDSIEHSRMVLEAMRHLADQQYDRAERTRSSARQTFAFVAALFTVAQTVAFTGFSADLVSGDERAWILRLGIAAAWTLGVTGICALATEALRRVSDISARDLLEEADEAEEADEFVGDRYIKLYVDSTQARTKAVESRQPWRLATTVVAIMTVLLVVAEIAVSLIARLS